MFDAIIFKNAIGPGPLIDVGALAEAMIFYGRVGIVGNTATILDLLARVSPSVVLSLLRDRRLEFYYLTDQIGVSATPCRDRMDRHNLVRVSSPDHTIETAAYKTFLEAAGDTSQARIGARQFTKLLSNLDHAQFDQESILQALSDHNASAASVGLLLQEVVPSFSQPPDLHFSVHRESQELCVDTNIDIKTAKSYVAVLSGIERDLKTILKDCPDHFTFKSVSEGLIDIRDSQTAGVVAFARGTPFATMTAGTLSVARQRVKVNAQQLDQNRATIEQLDRRLWPAAHGRRSAQQ
ncbi:MAG: hypothetical protein HY650_15380 [Acidobacteria bacterium]|nr:hypothetical protein [Acidobacteriota bacterium]